MEIVSSQATLQSIAAQLTKATEVPSTFRCRLQYSVLSTSTSLLSNLQLETVSNGGRSSNVLTLVARYQSLRESRVCSSAWTMALIPRGSLLQP